MDRTIPFSFKFSFFFLVFVSKQIACLFASIILCSPFFASNSNCKLNDIYRYRFVKDTLLPIETKMKEIVIGSLRMFTKQFLIHDNMRDSNGFVAVCSVSQVLFRLRRAFRWCNSMHPWSFVALFMRNQIHRAFTVICVMQADRKNAKVHCDRKNKTKGAKHAQRTRESSIVSEYSRTHRDLMHLSQNYQTINTRSAHHDVDDDDDNDENNDNDRAQTPNTQPKWAWVVYIRECKRNEQERNTCFSIDNTCSHQICFLSVHFNWHRRSVCCCIVRRACLSNWLCCCCLLYAKCNCTMCCCCIYNLHSCKCTLCPPHLQSFLFSRSMCALRFKESLNEKKRFEI